MPHGKIGGKQHRCSGKTKPIAGQSKDCDLRDDKFGCLAHENYCEEHDWIFRKDQTCNKCDIAKQKAKEEKEKREKAKGKDDHDHNLRKRKNNDDDDNDEEEPKPQNKAARDTAKKITKMSKYAGNKQKQTKKQKEAKKVDGKKNTFESGSRFYKALLEIWEGRD